MNPCKTSFDACSLQPTDGVSGQYAGLLVIRQETEDTGRTEHMRSRMDLLYQQFLPLDEHFAIRSAVMTTSDCWVILDNRMRMLEVTMKECHGLHRYDRVSLEGDTSAQSSLRRTMARINSWYNFQADEIHVSRVINQHSVQVTEIVVYLSTTENLELFEDDPEGHQNSPLKKNMLKGVIIVDIELVAAKSYKSPDYSRWNGWQSIVIEFEYGDDWMDKVDGNSQCLETYDTMRKTTESERKAKDQITEQANNSVRNGGRRYREPSESLSKIESVESKVENEMLSVKVRLAKTIRWNQVKSGADAEKQVSDDAKKSIAETTQLLENVVEQLSKSGMIGLTYETLKMRNQVHQVKEELTQELSKENGKDDTKLRNFAAKV